MKLLQVQRLWAAEKSFDSKKSGPKVRFFCLYTMGILRKLNIWCIDVALAAGLLAIAFAHLWNIELPLTVPLLLSIAVWLIYTFDHLKDAFDTREPGLSVRRDLHRKYARQLVLVSIVLLFTAAGLVFTIPVNVVVYGAAMSLLVIAYYLTLHLTERKSLVKKEVVVAILYTTGVVLGPLATGHPADGFQVHIVQLFLLAMNNLLLFSWFDHEIDEKEGFTNLVTMIGAGRTRKLLVVLSIAQSVLALSLSAAGFYQNFELLWSIMGIFMLLPVLRPVFWRLGYRYRILGDLLFFVPSAIILLA